MTSFKPYPSYKESGIGWIGSIPETWSLKKTKYLFRIEKRIVGELGHDVLSITQKGIKVKDVESGGGQLAMDYSKYQLVRKGDFAMNHMDLLTGYVDISKYDGVISPDYRVFQLKDKNCDPNYFLYLYQKAYWDKLFYPLGQGSSQLGRWRFPSDEFNLFQWPIPPKKEQTAIANFLDSKTAEIQAFIALKEKTIELLKERKTAIINQAVTKGLDPNVEMKDSGIEWLGQIPKHWFIFRLKTIIKSQTNGIWGEDPSPFKRNVICIRVADFNRNFESLNSKKLTKRGLTNSEYQSRKLNNGDLLIEKSGGGETTPVGRVGVFDLQNIQAVCSNFMARITINEKYCKPKYSYYIFKTIYDQQLTIKSIKQTTGIQNIDTSQYFNELVTLPPSEDEQLEIMKYINDISVTINNSISQAEKEIALIKEYQQSLISEAVTGKIDVRDWEKSSKSYATSEAEDKLSMAAEESPEYERNTRH